MILAAASAVILISAAIAYLAIKGFPVLEKPGGKEPPAATQIHESKEFKYRFVFPDSAWKQDNTTRLHIKANCLAMRRTNPSAWFGLAAREFRTRTPYKQEVTDEAVKRLEGYFKELEWDHAPDGFLAQQPAWIFVFQGKVDNTLMKGECQILSHNNTVFWFTTWCAAQDAGALASEWPKIREGFSLLDSREN